MSKDHPRSSRKLVPTLCAGLPHGRLDEALEQAARGKPGQSDTLTGKPESNGKPQGKQRRQYLREYARWLWPHRYAVGAVFIFALLAGGMEMVQPLFMRFIVDKVLLKSDLDVPCRLARLQLAGAVFLTVIIISNVIGALKDYRQRLLNAGVMLSMRRALFDRLLHLPLPKLWDMKTGGILSRLSGDVDTTTGLLQLAIVSPSVSLIRLLIAVAVLLTLNWRLALTALAIIPGVMLVSFTVAKRVRPIYRSMRKDAELIDGRVG
jgi:ATP-binding cassette subfamily B protein/subfamily B ATP-binding cassette protein MsbA